MSQASHYSIVRFVSDMTGTDSIAIGMIALSGGKVYFGLSREKVKIANKIGPNCTILLDFALSHLREYMTRNGTDIPKGIFPPSNKVDLAYLRHLADYNNGILQFSRPSLIAMDFNTGNFPFWYSKFVGAFPDGKPLGKVREAGRSLQRSVKKNLYDPCQAYIDVDYTLPQASVPSQYIDFHFDGLGVNGAVCGVKAIDFALKSGDTVKHRVAEYENIIGKVSQYAATKGVSGNARFFLVTERDKVSLSNQDIYAILHHDSMPFELADVSDLDRITKEIADSHAGKFSELLKGR